MKCVAGKDIKVLKSGAGYYIGTLCDDGAPNCRISVQYFAKEDDAAIALLNGDFYFRDCMENTWCANCHGGANCFCKGV